jgi:SOS-response transcriptional repressor LexA
MRQQKKTELKQHFSRSLRELRVQRGWTQGDLAKFLGVTTGAVGNWETQANGVTVRRLKVLSDKLGLPIEYFRGGPPPAEALAAKGAGQTGPRVASSTRRVPKVHWENASEAKDYTEIGLAADDFIETDCRAPECFALVLEGDSMEPEFKAGDIVVFAPKSEPRNGEVVVCRLKAGPGLLLRRFRRGGAEGQSIRLESINANYQPVEAQAKDVAFVYPVAQLYRRFRSY